MDNVIKGRVVAVPPMATGEGQRGPWKRQTVVIEFQDGRYTSKLARDKFTDLLAARGADWDIRMRRLDDADLERERRIFGAS